jgi:phosphoserine phosphatase
MRRDDRQIAHRLIHSPPPQFHARVHALAPKSPSSTATAPSGPATPARPSCAGPSTPACSRATPPIAWLDDRYDGYKRGEVSELAICGEMVQVYHGLRVDTLRAAAAEFFARARRAQHLPRDARARHRTASRGVDIWAVSSTCDWVIEEGVKRFNIPANRVLAARVVISNGLVTDRLLDVPTDEGKVTSLRRAGITAPDAVFGNSVHDAAMLAIARASSPRSSFAANRRESRGLHLPAPSPTNPWPSSGSFLVARSSPAKASEAGPRPRTQRRTRPSQAAIGPRTSPPSAIPTATAAPSRLSSSLVTTASRASSINNIFQQMLWTPVLASA